MRPQETESSLLTGEHDINMPRSNSTCMNINITRNAQKKFIETEAGRYKNHSNSSLESYELDKQMKFPKINLEENSSANSITQGDSTYGLENNLETAESSKVI